MTPDNRLLWLQRGSGRARIGKDGDYFRFAAGDGLLIPPGVDHDFIADSDTPTLFFAIHFGISMLGGVNPLELLGFPRYLPADAEAPYAGAARRMAREFALGAPGWERAIAGDMLSIILYLIRYQGSLFQPLGERGQSRQVLRLVPALELIDDRLADPALRVEDIAASVSVSQVYLRSLFHNAVGMSPGAFLQRRRIERASFLLRDSSLGLEQVAERSGFAHMSHFFRTFKRWTQMTPSQFRDAEIGI